jgi:pimeloyl-ACP methyl ester carboxylesterase
MGLTAYDALAARDDVDESRIVLFGFSMGTGVANYVASCRAPIGLMLFAPYADGYDLYNTMVPIFVGPLRALVAFKMESIRFAESIRVKPLVFSSVDDKVIPFASSERLSRAYPAGCYLEQMQGLGHKRLLGFGCGIAACLPISFGGDRLWSITTKRPARVCLPLPEQLRSVAPLRGFCSVRF